MAKSSIVTVAERLYQALQGGDADALVELLDPTFTARVSEGMPLGVGGDIGDPKNMLMNVWGKVAGEYAAAPYPDEYLEVGDDRVVVLGYYRGKARSTGRKYDAAFCHVITVSGDQIISLTQITDTKRWHDALE